MGRVIQTGDTPAKRRSAAMRSAAEVLRLLAERPAFDDESRDMTAFLASNLRSIHETIEESAQAWDDRNYWRKSEALRAKWRWSRPAAEQLEELLLAERWDDTPPGLSALIPEVSRITHTPITRYADPAV